ncbi:MAG: ABC transporter substrate-binding protein [Actinomycetota bacterium]
MTHTTTRRRWRSLAVILSAGTLVLAACGSDDDDDGDDASDTTSAPAETEAPADTEPPATEAPPETDAPVDTEPPATEAPPETDPPADEELRVVSLSPTHTEIMFAIGAGDLLVAVDEFSNFPAEALELPNELSGFEPNVEEIAAFEPDLVLIGGDFTGLGAQLDDLGIGWWDGPAAASLDDTYAQIAQLGDATGNADGAADVIDGMQTRIAEIIDEVGDIGAGLSFYHEIDATFFSADSTTFIGQIYSLLGLRNIADADESESFGFPQLNVEFIIEQNPDIIFLPSGVFYLETPEGVAARDGWDVIAAVQNGNVIATNDEIGGRWGPRIVEYLESVAAALAEVQVPVGG